MERKLLISSSLQFYREIKPDEHHFILICPQYDYIRKVCLKRYHYTRPSMHKLVQFFQNDNITSLKNLARYIIQTLKCRNSIANNSAGLVYILSIL